MGDDERTSNAGVFPPSPAHLLRMQAEKIHRQKVADKPNPMTAGLPPTARHMLHELQVHQIELELQNEELRRAQSDLSASRERYFELYDLAPVGYCSVDGNGLIMQGNLTLANLLGIERREMLGRPFSRFVEREDQDAFYFLKKRFVRGAVQSCELRMTRADGGWFWASVAASQVVDQEGMTTLRLTLDNVSARKEAEARLLQSERELHGMRLLDKERQLNGVIDSAMDAIVAVDQAFRVVLFNPAAAKMFGVPAGEAIGGRIDRFLPRRFRGAHAGTMQAFGLDVTGARRMGEGREIFGLRANGEEFPIEAKISHTEIGGKTMYTAILRDLTQRNSMEAALNLSRQKLHELVAHQQQELERMRTRIAGEIHDELGTLLVGIKGNVSRAIADFERSGTMPVERLQEACRLIDSAAGEVRRLIVDLHPSVLDVLGIWEALDWLAEETEQRTGLRCRIAMAPAATEVELDLERSTALFRIVQEALTNVARHANASEVDIRIGMEDRVIGMELDDNGRGIDVKHHAGSSSWGLAGMAERARNVGGEVKIANLSPGTRISLRLPLEKTGA